MGGAEDLMRAGLELLGALFFKREAPGWAAVCTLVMDTIGSGGVFPVSIAISIDDRRLGSTPGILARVVTSTLSFLLILLLSDEEAANAEDGRTGGFCNNSDSFFKLILGPVDTPPPTSTFFLCTTVTLISELMRPISGCCCLLLIVLFLVLLPEDATTLLLATMPLEVSCSTVAGVAGVVVVVLFEAPMDFFGSTNVAAAEALAAVAGFIKISSSLSC